MKREIILFTTEEAWKSERVKDLTSSDIPVLFGVGYPTYNQLFEAKLYGKEIPFEGNERVDWGVALQDSIAGEFARKHDWRITKKSEYIRVPYLRIGSSFDFEIQCESKEKELLEIKNVSIDSFKSWVKGFEIEATPYIELQVQHQLLVSGLETAYIGALIGGCKGIVLHRKANPKIQQAILTKATEFWRRIDEQKLASKT